MSILLPHDLCYGRNSSIWPQHLPTPQYPFLLIGTLRSSLRSPAQDEITQGFLLKPEKDLESLSSTSHDARFPYHDSRACRSPTHNSNGDLTSLGPHERLPELFLISREKSYTVTGAREISRDSPVIARLGPSFPAGPREKSRVLS